MRNLITLGLLALTIHATSAMAGSYERAMEDSVHRDAGEYDDAYTGHRAYIIDRGNTLLKRRASENVLREYQEGRRREYNVQNPYKPNPAYERYLEQQRYRY